MTKSGKGILHLLNIIGKLADDRIMMENIKKDPELRKRSKVFGASAIWQSVLFALFVSGGVFLLIVGFTKPLAVIGNIAAIAGGFGLVLLSAELFIFALSHTIKQMVLNRRAISWIALLVFIACTALAVLALVYVLRPILN